MDAREVFAEYWTRDNLIEEYRLKGIKCAEVLVPDCVATKYISGAYVANTFALRSFEKGSSLVV